MSTDDTINLRGPLHLNCPHCHNPIELLAKTPEEEVHCPSCGSSFHLDADRAQSWSKDKLPKLGNFELIEAVGRGAFGAVYRARDTQLQRIVAVKVPRSGQLATEDDEARFVREARNAAQLQHSGIVPVYEVGHSDDFPYIVSEFVEGITLTDALTARKFSFREAAELVARVAESLQHAHEKGVVHRDLKPSNIMLAADGSPRVMDFGLAKRDAGEITMTVEGQVLGTPAYMSPEQASGQAHQVDGRSDVYSLGVILFELLTGELPFRGNQRMLLHQVMHDEPRAPRGLNDRIPRDLDTIALKCLQKEPAKRYQSAEDLDADLNRWLTGEPIHARPVRRIERGWRWARRNRGLATAVTIVAALLTTVATISTVSAVRINAERQRANQKTEEALAEKFRADRKTKEALAEKNRADQQATELRASNVSLVAAREQADINLQSATRERDLAATNLRLATRRLYNSDLRAVQAAWDRHELSRMRELLDAELPDRTQHEDLRGFEWHFWKNKLGANQLTFLAHQGGVRGVALSTDGQSIASGGEDDLVKIWDAATGRCVSTLRGHTSSVLAVAWSPNGDYLYSAGRDRTVRVWDRSNGNMVHVLKGHRGAVETLAVSPDGRLLVSGSADKTIRVWNCETGNHIKTLTGHASVVKSVSFGQDSERLLSGSGDSTLKIWGLRDGTCESTISAFIPVAAWSPDGKVLASGGNDMRLTLRNAASAEITAEIPTPGDGVTSVAFSDNGQTVVQSCLNGAIKLSHVANPVDSTIMMGHSSDACSVDSNADGTRIVSGGLDGTIIIWKVPFSSEPSKIETSSLNITCLDFAPDNESVVIGSDDRAVRLCSLGDRPTMKTLGHHVGSVLGVAFDPSGKRVVSASRDGTLRVWDVKTGQILHSLQGHTGDVFHGEFDAAGKTIVSASHDGTSRVWDVNSGVELLCCRVQSDRLEGAIFVLDGSKIACGGINGTIRLFDSASARELVQISAHDGFIPTVAAAPDGRRFVTGGRDRLIKVWDAATAKELMSLRGHTAQIRTVAFSSDGKRLISASYDGVVRLWDAITGQELLTFNVGKTLNCVAISPNGLKFAAGGSDSLLRVWDCAMPTASDDKVNAIDVSSPEEPRAPADLTAVNLSWDVAFYRWDEVENKKPKDWPGVVAGKPLETRRTKQIDFVWGGSAPAVNVPAEQFAVVATATQILKAGTYELTVVSDDGVRVFIDEKIVLDQWRDRSATIDKATVALTEGEHSFRIEYFEWRADAALQFAMHRVGSFPDR